MKMYKFLQTVIFSLFMVWNHATAQTTTYAPGAVNNSVVFKSGYLHVNGVKLFWKEAGQGRPILFLHGGLGDSEAHFANQLEVFAKTNRVITFHTRGHGKSEFNDKKLGYQLFADDTYAVLRQLKLDSIDIVGFSDGAIIGAMLAMQHPGMVKKLVMIGANATVDALYPETIEWVRGWDEAKMTAYARSVFKEHPQPERLQDYVAQMQKVFLTEPDLKEADLQKISCPTLLMAGDHDMIKTEHQVYLYRSIPKSSLSILSDAGHEAHIERPVIANEMIRSFLEKKE